MSEFRECQRCISASCEHYRRCRYHELMSYRRDSDRSGEADKTGTGLAEGESAGRKASPTPIQETPQ